MELNPSLNTDSTPISDEAQPVSDRRSGERQVSVMLTAKLEAGGRQQPCRILNISVKGANIETLIELQVGQPIDIEFRSNLKLHGVVRWVRHSQAGVEFQNAIDLNEIWKRTEASIMRIKPRPPRFCCFAPATIETADGNQICQIIDISASGLRVIDLSDVPTGTTVMIEAEGLSRHRAVVIWCNANSAGLKLVNAYKYSELESWLLRQEGRSDADRHAN